MAKTNDRLFIVADSSGLFSLTSPVDVNHTHAVVAAKRLSSPQTTILVPYDVYAETVNLVGKKAGHAKAVDVAHLMHSTPPFVVIDSSSQARRTALDRFAVLPQSVSYTDCVVMAVADEYHTTQIFGFDEDFKKHGYRVLPSPGRQAA